MVAVASSLRTRQNDQYWDDAPAATVVALKGAVIRAPHTRLRRTNRMGLCCTNSLVVAADARTMVVCYIVRSNGWTLCLYYIRMSHRERWRTGVSRRANILQFLQFLQD